MVKDLPQKLIQMLKTHEQAELMQSILLDTLDSTFTKKGAAIDRLNEALPAVLQQNLFSFLQGEKVDLNNKKEIFEIIQQITSELPNLSILEITLAIQPEYDVQDFLFKTVNRLSNKPLLLKLQYSPDIVGGAIIQHNGLYRDYSLKKKFTTL